MEKLINRYKKIGLNADESIEEINYLFLDIIQNYKEVSILKSLFEDISDFAENIEIEGVLDKWSGFKRSFEEHNKLVENCIVSKILSSVVSNDIEEMIISFQMIILEYLLVRYAVFLKYCINENINTKDIKDYIVAFSRIIGNNTKAMVDFFEDSFGEVILELGYLSFIALF
ncbi:lysine-N-methylase [Clostridium cavendishii DSM 21758]|uniref:Lysine-N-methylase n=1 Tax=Clostridium cavendishii DSM 21758 TaxID=1121302 RepID=A0A1M6HKL0_9CLOT|nr:lysine-N-methylase [Clostridium cavendishii DSM 21758]